MTKLFLLVFLLLALGNPLTQAWIAGLYVVDDGLRPVDVIVPLRSDVEEQRVRLEHAARLVRERYAPLLLVSVDSRPLYGQTLRSFIEKHLDQQKFPSQQLRFCENRADSTSEEARAIRHCLRQMGARQALIVTSDYHTRRSRFIFQRAFAGSGVGPLVHPVQNQEEWDRHWWRKRRWAKRHVLESMSLAWSAVEEWISPSPGLQAWVSGDRK